jgi:hypothetical protein
VVRLAWLWVLAGAAGCGEALVPGEWTEDPLLTVRGRILEPDAPSLRVGALWVDPLQQADDWPSPPLVAAGTVKPSGEFTLAFFNPPPRSVIREIRPPDRPDEVAFAFALAEIVAFEDRDGDGTFRVSSLASGSMILDGDVYRGTPDDTQNGQGVFYIERSRSRSDDTNVIFELDRVLLAPRGYHLAKILCAGAPRAEVSPPYPKDQLPALTIALLPPSTTFPHTRLCLRTHPPAP